MLQQIELPEQLTECPVCRSTSIGYTHSEDEGETLYRHVSCDKCGFTWSESYTFANTYYELND
jgi:DNA-directed RNA polymerase subunit M/transcription elongation factor TFIIS